MRGTTEGLVGLNTLVDLVVNDYWMRMSDFSANEVNIPSSEITKTIIQSAMRVHSHLGPGLLESSYEICLEDELKNKGLHIERQMVLPLKYFEKQSDAGYRIDLMVEKEVIVEIKSVDALLSIHQAQLLTYLKLAQKPVGLLINFNVPHLRDGIKRLIRKQS